MLQILTSKWMLFSTALVVISLSGCGPTPDPTGSLTGTVKSNGEIYDGKCIVSISGDSGRVNRGTTANENGSYEVTEIPFGDYQVRVFEKPNNEPIEVRDKRIPGKYRSVETSGLTFTIASEEPVVLDINME